MFRMLRTNLIAIVCSGLAWLLASSGLHAASPKHTFEIGDEAFLLDGKAFVIRCGEVHAARVPREYWRHRLQMARAMGLNTVCAYLFWNQIEPRPGQFDWSGRADIAEFCRIAQEEGLWVILRPGPYACAEWEMGGLPWWLLKHDDLRLRSRDPRFLDAARRYLKEVGRELAPLQVTRGGPILMVQAENEYGFYGRDANYMGEIRKALLDAGFDVPLFACNPTGKLKSGFRDDLFPVVNFGTNPEGAFKALREILPKGPLMCGEFYPGWFDTWGTAHRRGDTERYLKDLETILQMNASFSIYMAHGGTSFGFSPGADRPFKPDTSSYDYDAPISEAGWTTDKFFKTRELFSRYLNPGETIPEPPAALPVIGFPGVTSNGFAPLLEALPQPVRAADPLSFEKIDQPYGCVLYRATLPAGPAAELQAKAVNDLGLVYLDGKQIGAMDRRTRSFSLKLSAREKPAVLEILVEAMGRVNFGKEVHDRKGLFGPVLLDSQPILNWEMISLPLDSGHLGKLSFGTPFTPSAKPARQTPGFHRFQPKLPTVGDTFIDMRPFGKGMVWVNGHHLGRFWNIGPQQTMFVPGAWLREGQNEFIVLDLIGPTENSLQGLKLPILDQLRPELDTLVARTTISPARAAGNPVFRNTFPASDTAQEIRFPQPLRGRYLTLEALSSHDGKPFASIADLSVLDAQGNPLNTQAWTIAGISSQETASAAGDAGNAIDGQTANFWQSTATRPSLPQWITLDFGRVETITGFIYTPRQGSGNDIPGRIRDYQLYLGDGLIPKP
ncbi:MAG: beta-galactosidase [Luteolibacter sp.]